MPEILLIDDEEGILDISKTYLENQDPTFICTTISNPQKAFNEIISNSFDIVVTDYKMPELDGLQLLEKIRSSGYEIPVIIFTGQGREEVAMKALNLGADYYLMKTGHSKNLYAELAHIIRKTLSQRQLKLSLKESEKALLESEERFRTIFNEANDGFLVASLETKKFISANKMICKMLGYELEEILNLSVLDIHPKESLPYVIEQFEKQSKEEMSVAIDLPVRRKEGTIFYADISSRPVFFGGKSYLLGIFRDITNRREIKRALEESEKRFIQVTENAHEWVWEVDVNGLYTYCSVAVEKILGFKQDEVVGKKHFYDLFHPEDRNRIKKMAFEVFEQKQPFREFINRNIKSNGEEVWLSTSGVPILDENDKLIGYRGVDVDFTKSKQIEEELMRQKEELSKFAHSITHNIKNQLTVIHNNCSLLKKDQKLEYIEKIEDQIITIMNQLENSLKLAEEGTSE
ncbi:MAG: PAS domain S-box protein [Candidatus Heimdallarchaeota archaeon]|nr:PAS domain S-box protein [Candidatus Heimdallarchaeota archaeon]MCK5047964.1 PAS domain S-box protein [Candidatus Heimdallarchaeota archaeon]